MMKITMSSEFWDLIKSKITSQTDMVGVANVLNEIDSEIKKCNQFNISDSSYSEDSDVVFYVGSRVKISQSSKFYRDDDDEYNPKDEFGVIYDIDSSCDAIYVEWENGNINSYNRSDLVL